MSENCCCLGSDCCSQTDIIPTSTTLTFKDRLGAFKARWGINRNNYKVESGMYAVGKPNQDSPVLVTANYKLTFDTVRKNLKGLDCYLLILDTKGVNVWCAAGKGTFGTDELVNRINATCLYNHVSHRDIILPQLGATGVSAHEIKKRTGFNVIYGTIRASDIKAFIANDYKADEKMRTVKFTLWDRAVLTPIELVHSFKISMIVFGVMFLLNLFTANKFDIYDFIIYAGTVVTGAVITPVLLPFVPFRAFSLKGWILGFAWVGSALWLFDWFNAENWLIAAGYLLLLPPLSAYAALNFTGCSTFTSLSGTLKETRAALPFMIISAFIGAVLVIMGKI